MQFFLPFTRYRSLHCHTRLNYDVTAKAVACVRKQGRIQENWSEEIQAEYVRRGGKR